MRDGYRDRVTRGPKRNRTVFGQWRASGGGGGGKVGCLPIRPEQKEGVVVVKRLTSDISKHCAGGRLVLKRDIDGSHDARGWS